jgi:hypothetical protein
MARYLLLIAGLVMFALLGSSTTFPIIYPGELVLEYGSPEQFSGVILDFNRYSTHGEASISLAISGKVSALSSSWSRELYDPIEGRGNIEIELDDGGTLIVRHLKDITLRVGDKVTPDTILGKTINDSSSAWYYDVIRLDRAGNRIDPNS